MRWPVPKRAARSKFDPDELAQCLAEYYQLLSRTAYFPPEDIKYPPQGGWTDDDLEMEGLRGLKFPDAVINTLRKLPYVANQSFQIWPGTACLSYLRNKDPDATPVSWAEDLERYLYAEPRPIAEAPTTMVALSHGDGASEPWILDTKTGSIFGNMGCSEVDDYPEDQPWKANKHYPVRYFFDKAKADIMSLRCLPVPVGTNEHNPEILDYDTEETQAMKKIYSEHGWPNLDTFRREECIAALKEFRKLELQRRREEDEWEDEEDDDNDDYEDDN